MEKVSVQVDVAKEVYELAKGLSQFLAVVKKEVADNGGWSMGDDLPGIVTAALTNLLPALQGVEKIADEIKEDKLAFAKGLMVGLSDMVDVFVKAE